MTTKHPEYTISSEFARMDFGVIHAYLTQSYWSPGIPRATVERAAANSMCFGLFHRADQVGFARVITDKATFAYLADVFVLEAHRGKGLSKFLVETIQADPALRGLRRFLLATRDAHGLYTQFGFRPLADPLPFMEIRNPRVYAEAAADDGNGTGL